MSNSESDLATKNSMMEDQDPIIMHVEGPTEFPVPLSDIKSEPPDDSNVQEKPADDDVIYIDTETTMKYLEGQMSFAEFYALLDQIKDEPDIEEELHEVIVEDTRLSDEEEPPSSSSAPEPPSDQQVQEDNKEKKPRKNKKKSYLSETDKGLMGQANMMFTEGKYEEALTMCKELIRIAPRAPEPYHTLALIYEAQGLDTKAFQLYLVAAHLNPRNTDEWERLAQESLKRDDIDQAILCYTKAIAASKKNIELYRARCDLYEIKGAQRRANEGYLEILKLTPKEQYSQYVNLARDVTKRFHQMGDRKKAIETMEVTFKLHANHIALEDINLLLELYILEHRYYSVLEVVVQQCGVVIEFEKGLLTYSEDHPQPINIDTDMGRVKSCDVPPHLHIDLRSKLIVALIHLRKQDAVQALLEAFHREDVNEIGDLYLDVAEAFIANDDLCEARDLLKLLVNSDKYSLAAVWLRYAECLNSLQDIPTAIDAYEHVLNQVPRHAEARLSLSVLYGKQGKHQLALDVLKRDEDLADTQGRYELLTEQCRLLLERNHIRQYTDTAKMLLCGPLMEILSPSLLMSLSENKSLRHRYQQLKEQRLHGVVLYEKYKAVIESFTYTKDQEEELWALYKQACKHLISLKDFYNLQLMNLFCAYLPFFTQNQQRADLIEFNSFMSHVLARDGVLALSYIRYHCSKNIESIQGWNTFGTVASLSKDLRHGRSCARLLLKAPTSIPLGLLNGHIALISSNYKHALGEYISVFQKLPRNPMISLLIGLSFAHIASQKYTANRQDIVTQACTFLMQYLELRGNCQEAFYNVGRVYHQLGILHAAVHYYRESLRYPPAIDTEHGEFDLQHMAAFNLSMIYRSSGAHKLASLIVQQYLVV